MTRCQGAITVAVSNCPPRPTAPGVSVFISTTPPVANRPGDFWVTPPVNAGDPATLAVWNGTGWVTIAGAGDCDGAHIVSDVEPTVPAGGHPVGALWINPSL